MSCRKKVLDALGPCGVKHVMGTQLQIVEVCLEAIRWPRSRSESPHRLVKILGLASQVHLKRRFLWKWIHEKTVFMEMDPKMERKMEPRGTW